MAALLYTTGHSVSELRGQPRPLRTQFPGLGTDPWRLAPPRRASEHLPLQMAQSGDASREQEPVRSC